jgi:hypothetical protein
MYLLLAVLASAQEIKLPVFFLRYDGAMGFEAIDPEEVEEENETELDFKSHRHTITFRIKEEFSDDLTSNLYSAFSWKNYLESSGDYSYFYLNPNYIWDINDRLRWSSEFRAKWIWDAEPVNIGGSPDLTSLLAKTEFTIKLLDQLKIIPSLRSVFDLYREAAKAQQTYTAGLSFESRISPAWRLSGRYRGILREPLDTKSTVNERFNHEFGLNLNWDPNK